MLCKVLPGEIFPWFVRFWNAGTCFKFCDLFPGVNNAVIVNSCLVCEEGFEILAFFARRSVFLFIRVQSLDVCFQVEKVYFQQGFAVGSSQGLSVFGLLGSASVGF